MPLRALGAGVGIRAVQTARIRAGGANAPIDEEARQTPTAGRIVTFEAVVIAGCAVPIAGEIETLETGLTSIVFGTSFTGFAHLKAVSAEAIFQVKGLGAGGALRFRTVLHSTIDAPCKALGHCLIFKDEDPIDIEGCLRALVG